jgi:catechol 2,3-dioxygenase-like lactoylglutathione lyase family enzyme
MPLTTLAPIAFIPTNNPAAARAFYETTLGLTFVSDDNFAIVFRIGQTQTMLRVIRAGDFTPAPYSILGWEVSDIHATIAELSDPTRNQPVEFLRFSYFQQDEAGVWTAPTGDQVAWFKDPDGNTLSLSAHV